MTRLWILLAILASCTTTPPGPPVDDCAAGTCGDVEPDLVHGALLFEEAYAHPRLVTVGGQLWAGFGGVKPSAFPDVFPINYRDAGLVLIHPDGGARTAYPDLSDVEIASGGELVIAADSGLAKLSPPTVAAFVAHDYYDHVAATTSGYVATRRLDDSVERVEFLTSALAIESTVDITRNTSPIIGSGDDVVVFEGPPASLTARRIHRAREVADTLTALPFVALPGSRVDTAISTEDGGYVVLSDTGLLQVDATDAVIATISLGYPDDLVGGGCTLGQLTWDRGELVGVCFNRDQLAVFSAGPDGLRSHTTISPVTVESAAGVARTGDDFIVVFDRYQTIIAPDTDGPAGAVDTLNYPAMWSVTIHADASWDKPRLLATTAP